MTDIKSMTQQELSQFLKELGERRSAQSRSLRGCIGAPPPSTR